MFVLYLAIFKQINNMSIFHEQFYPTPKSVLDQMGIDCYGLNVLEPSAGKGDIIDYCIGSGASSVLACEINDDLRQIVQNKAQVIASDFFSVTSEMISHVNIIVMNPPFINADKHILHAWNIAPEGCEIIALCNYSTIERVRGWSRSELASVIEKYGEKTSLGDCFSEAERKTDVNVGLIHIFKPVVSESFDWDGFYFTDEEVTGSNGIMSYNEIRAIVNTYVAAVKCFEEAMEVGIRLNSLTGDNSFKISIGQEDNIVSKQEFARVFQVKQWKKVFTKMNIEKHVTKGVMEEINKFAAGRQNYPFTMRNVYRMMEIIYGTRESTMKKAIVEAVDNFTRYTHENRYGVEGWKTNEGHLLNMKFICNHICNADNGNLRIEYYNSRNFDSLTDLTKAVCYITGTDFNTIPDVRSVSCIADAEGLFLNSRGVKTKSFYECESYNDFKTNTWYDWGFFEFKLFKKGTGHFKFKDEKVWEQLNRVYADIKGQVLPEGSWRGR